MPNKIYSFLGLAKKAGQLVSGEDTCERAVKAGKVKLLILAEDASDNTKKCFNDICGYRDVSIRFFGSKELLGRYTGKELRAVVGIINPKFAERLIELIDGYRHESGGEQVVKS